MKKEPERYIYDEQESQETTRLISEAYQSGYVDMPDQESSSPAEYVQAAFFVCQSVKSDIASLL